ncbi:tRNA (adenine(22)-N(1))-methyltransferase [Isachenkonia alkalipeptolytica]|uniref:SAM-dependent methyltransferase n=1 Tax=Isachenkonia alkalipeptolytica TaxID=2565777 RepID=A0AA44BE24_9CLOT|nr:class I SAM-dependent methyltransferase [Isachenkonia alkalipeptolytica]NBG88498.1 SAM-dependent methyltransferase [Isachenkonia alkalipeptolytica]
MDLTPRLLKIAEEIRSEEKVGDIGTDHGYLPIYLVENRIAKEVIATDINQEPLKAAYKNIKSHGMEKQIKTKLGAGTLPLETENLDVVIIAGMGGKLIIEILKESRSLKKSVDRIILQPMQQQKELRMYLFKQGFDIKKDLLVQEDRRIYEVLVVSLKTYSNSGGKSNRENSVLGEKTAQIAKNHPTGFQIYNELRWELGFFLFENPKNLVLKFLDQKINQMEKIIRETQGAKSQAANLVNQRAMKKLENLKEVKGCL